MKKILRIVLYVLGAVLGLVVLGASYIHFRGIPSYTAETIAMKVRSTPEKVEKGLKLATTLCAGCHLNKELNALSGQQMLDVPPEFGKIFSANITQDATHGIGKWTDGQIAYLLRTGIRPDGRFIPPYMPKLVHASEADIEAIIAFLRSDHALVRAQPVPSMPTQPSFLTKFLCNTVVDFQPFAYPNRPIPEPDTTNLLQHGEYLINLYDCYACHSNNFQTLNIKEPRKSKGYLGGGNAVYNLKGEKVLTPNLTPDEDTGIGTWTEQMFADAVRNGKNQRGGEALKYPMLPYSRLTDAEIKAMFAYLKTVPPIKNKVH